MTLLLILVLFLVVRVRLLLRRRGIKGGRRVVMLVRIVLSLLVRLRSGRVLGMRSFGLLMV